MKKEQNSLTTLPLQTIGGNRMQTNTASVGNVHPQLLNTRRLGGALIKIFGYPGIYDAGSLVSCLKGGGGKSFCLWSSEVD